MAKRPKVYWAAGGPVVVNESTEGPDGFALKKAGTGDGELVFLVIDPEGRNVGQGDSGTSALDDALEKGYLAKGHDKTVKAWKKEQ